MAALVIFVFGFLLSSSSSVKANSCSAAPESSYPYCNPSLPIEQRVADLVGRLQLNEKIPLLQNTAGSVSRLNLPAYQWWSEALHGVAGSPGVSFRAPTPFATSFPQVICTASSFNRTLFNDIGLAIGDEARSFSNVGNAGLTFWAPNINIFRDPRWGRGQETPGEDPYLTSEYAANFISGMQDGVDSTHLKVSSCSKHFFCYNLEDWGGVDRHHFNAVVDDQDLADTYLPAFESAVRRGHVSSVMCSYNSVNGVPSCANYDFLTVVLRETWGFEGYITSDCGAVNDVYDAHHYYNTTDATCYGVLAAGMDIECGTFLQENLAAAVSHGVVPESLIDTALTNLFSVQMRLGMFDPPAAQPYLNYTYEEFVNSEAHQQLALDAARQGQVLLKNTNGFLPLSVSSHPAIALIGPNANATTTLKGNYAGTPQYLISPLMGLQSYTSHVTYTAGCAEVACSVTVGFPAAVSAAQEADVAVLVIGLDQTQESEGHDRTSISLPGYQNTLVSEVCAVAKACVVVVMTGGPVDISLIKSNPKVAAILYTGYPGQSGGQAIADVIFGVYNPGGRLPVTIYPSQFTSEVSMFDVGMRPNASDGNPGRTYRFYTGEAVYSFGDGLSYTTFSYSNSSSSSLVASKAQLEAYFAANKHNYMRNPTSDTVDTITITVTNTGNVAGSDVVLCFVQDPIPGETGNPLKELVGFERVYLNPGASVSVSFPVTPHDLSEVDHHGRRVVREGVKVFSVGDVFVPFTITE